MLADHLTRVALGDARVLRSGRWLWLRALGWMAISVFAIALPFGFYSDAAAHFGGNSEAGRFAARCGGPLIALLIYAMLVRVGEARQPSEISARPAAPQLLIGLLLGTVMFAAVMAVLTSSGLYHSRWVGLVPAWHDAGAAIEAGFVEELLIRGLVFRLVWRAFGPAVAFLLSSAAFGLGHAGNPNATAFSVFCIALEAGVMLGAFYALTGRLWLSIGVHVSWNFAQGYFFGARVSGETFGPSITVSQAIEGMPVWLTGGSFGPEASLPCLVVCTIVGATTLWLAMRSGHLERLPTSRAPLKPSTAARVL